MARRAFEEDRLAAAAAAMDLALRAGLQPGDIYDLQRTIEAELGAREAGRIWRLEEHALVEGDPLFWHGVWPRLLAHIPPVVADCAAMLRVRWGRPVLVTLVPSDEWVQYVHARYGYYRETVPWHKVCLPHSMVSSSDLQSRALRHEVAHAAVHQLAGGEAPRWLDEGIAVLMEGGPQPEERRRYGIFAARRGRPRLSEIADRLAGYALDLGSGDAAVCYAAAADFTSVLHSQAGWMGLGAVLRRLGDGEPVERALRRVLGVDLRRLEREWRGTQAGS